MSRCPSPLRSASTTDLVLGAAPLRCSAQFVQAADETIGAIFATPEPADEGSTKGDHGATQKWSAKSQRSGALQSASVRHSTHRKVVASHTLKGDMVQCSLRVHWTHSDVGLHARKPNLQSASVRQSTQVCWVSQTPRGQSASLKQSTLTHSLLGEQLYLSN